MKKMLQKSKGKLKREYVFSDRDRKAVMYISWNKEKLFFNCSIVFLRKQKDGKWKCPIRWDDAHGYRHLDSENKLKMPSGRLLRLQCPILYAIINSLPKDKADTWKAKLFDEFALGEQKWKEFLDNIGHENT